MIQSSQNSAQLKLNYNLVVLTKHSNDWLVDFNNFSFLRTDINKTLSRLNNFNKLIQFSKLQPTIYFFNH